MKDDTPGYRLYTSEQAALRVGGDLTASLFDRLASSGRVEYTLIGRKVRWTDEQIAAVVAHHAIAANTKNTEIPEPATQVSISAQQTRPGSVSFLTAKPGGRYAKSAGAA